MAIVAVVTIFIFPFLVPGIFGLIGLSQIKNSRGAEKGEGLAIAGIIVGAIGLLIIFAALVSS